MAAETLCRARYTYNTSVLDQNCTINNEPFNQCAELTMPDTNQCAELTMPDTNQQCHEDMMPGANQSLGCHDTMPSI